MAASAARDSEKIGFPPFTVNNAEMARTRYIFSQRFGVKKETERQSRACPSLVCFGTKAKEGVTVTLPTYRQSVTTVIF
jgi:hypothetical protein